ncbi:MAG: hypothetical protein HYV35_06945 [Lentisphaerae bacterium]|nr:hypothetical protein [Lentisphaerota bacterium]
MQATSWSATPRFQVRKKLVAALWVAALGCCFPALSPAAGDDEWLGPDKPLHFGVSVLLDTAGYWTLREGGGEFSKAESLVLAALATLAVGVGKEISDEKFSEKDLAWDAAGIGFSTVVWTLADRRQDQFVVRISSSFASIQYQHAF